MSNNFAQFLADTVVRDDNLVQMMIMAIAAVLTWYTIPLIPWQRARNLARAAYLAGGVMMFLGSYLLLPRAQ